jgi:hypothetical protein
MEVCKLNHGIILPLLAVLIAVTILSIPVGQDRYAFSQPTKTNSTTNATGSGVDLVNTHPSPVNMKSGDRFEIISTVVNNLPDTILLPAGRCDSPLTAFFMRNVVIRQDQFQSCTATSPPFELNPGEEVTVAGPAPGTIYQAIKAGKTPATATVYYLTENGNPGNVTKPFVFTIN